jgi:cytoskeletal protein RodZ
VAKRPPENNRRRIIDEQRKKARAAERRKTVLTIVIASVVGLGIIGGAVWYGIQDKKNRPDTELAAVGAPAETAGCLEPKEEPIPKEATDATKHTQRDGDRVEYDKAPPTSGRHNPTPLPVGAKKFYSREDNPSPERAVHNLEHGYLVVWYDKKATDAQIEQLKQAAESAEGKFLVVPWPRDDFPDDKHIVLTAWAVRQQCSEVSGKVMQDFYDEHGGPNGTAPEKNVI